MCATQAGVNDARDAGTFATASTITFIAGLSLLTAGVTMYLAAPNATSASTGSGSYPTLAVEVRAMGLGGAAVMSGRF